MAEVLAKAEKYINGEEALLSKRESSSTRKEKGATDRRRGRSPKRQGDQRKSPGTERERSPKRRGNLLQVLREVRNEQFLRWSTQMKSDPTTRDNTRYCEFHRDYEHRTDNCIQLRREIEYLIQRGYLRRFISPGNQA